MSRAGSTLAGGHGLEPLLVVRRKLFTLMGPLQGMLFCGQFADPVHGVGVVHPRPSLDTFALILTLPFHANTPPELGASAKVPIL